VVATLGPIGGPLPGGGFGFLPGLGSQDVDFKGVVNVVDALEKHQPEQARAGKEKNLFSFKTEEDLKLWERLDDVIMGGRSSSSLALDDGFAEYRGDLIVEDGGFCGTRASNVNLDLSGYDGIRIKVMGDGYRYKLTLRTAGGDDSANIYAATENVYQVSEADPAVIIRELIE